MINKYHFKHIWILRLFFIPLLIGYAMVVYGLVSSNPDIYNIVFGIILTIVFQYIFRITVIKTPTIIVTDEFIKYDYIFFRRKAKIDNICGFEVINVFHRHQLLLKTDNMIKHKIWLDYLTADVETIVNDINSRIRDSN